MNKHIISIITVVENDPVTGIKYGATKIALPEEKKLCPNNRYAESLRNIRPGKGMSYR